MTETRVFISTGGAGSSYVSTAVAADLLQQAPFGVELSGGEHIDDVARRVRDIARPNRTMLHNYFPPPQEPIVLNLSEPDEEAYGRTRRLIEFALQISSEIGAPYYAVHAGFLATPNVGELGRTIARRDTLSRNTGLSLMTERLYSLARTARRLGVRLLVENHVLSPSNLESFGENFLLLVDPEEILRWHRGMGGEVGLLLDVGHLNVSARTLGFSAESAIAQLNPYVEGYHFSSNDGRNDDHAPLVASDWFWNAASRDKDFYTVEIHGSELARKVESAQMVYSWLAQEVEDSE